MHPKWYKRKKTFKYKAKKMWYKAMSPIAWCLDKIDEFQYKRDNGTRIIEFEDDSVVIKKLVKNIYSTIANKPEHNYVFIICGAKCTHWAAEDFTKPCHYKAFVPLKKYKLRNAIVRHKWDIGGQMELIEALKKHKYLSVKELDDSTLKYYNGIVSSSDSFQGIYEVKLKEV